MSRNPDFDAEILILKAQIPSSIVFKKVDTGNHFINDWNTAWALLDEMQRTYEAKDTDYAENSLPMGNLRSCEELGVPAWKGCLIRISDKKQRVGSFIKRGVFCVNDEKVHDTLLDLANYAILGMCLFREVIGSCPLEECLLILDYFHSIAYRAIECYLLHDLHAQELTEIIWSDTFWPDIEDLFQKIAEFAKLH